MKKDLRTRINTPAAGRAGLMHPHPPPASDPAWSTTLILRQQLAATATAIAETEDWLADTLDRMARVRPRDAERLRTRAARARTFAARERAQAAIYRSHPDSISAGGKSTH